MNSLGSKYEEHLRLLNKMCERVKGTELEPTWKRLETLMNKINNLNDYEKKTIDELIQRLLLKIDHFKYLSLKQIETSTPARNEPLLCEELGNITIEAMKTSRIHKHKARKLKRWRAEMRLIKMSPRRESIPKLILRRSALYTAKKKRESRRMKKQLRNATQSTINSDQQVYNSVTVNTENSTPKSSTNDSVNAENAEVIANEPALMPNVNHSMQICNEKFIEIPENTMIKDCFVRLSIPDELKTMQETGFTLNDVINIIPEEKTKSAGHENSEGISKNNDVEIVDLTASTPEHKIADTPKNDIIILKTVDLSSSKKRTSELKRLQNIVLKETFPILESRFRRNTVKKSLITSRRDSLPIIRPAYETPLPTASKTAKQSKIKRDSRNSICIPPNTSTELNQNQHKNLNDSGKTKTIEKVSTNMADSVGKAKTNSLVTSKMPRVMLRQEWRKSLSLDLPPVSRSDVTKNIISNSAQNRLPNARKSTARTNSSVTGTSTIQNGNQPSKQNSAQEIEQNQVRISNEAQEPLKTEPLTGCMTPPMTNIPIQNITASKLLPMDKKMILLSAEFTARKIRPWMENSEHRKYLKNCEQMLSNNYCLSSLFKCMGSTCSYFTSKSEHFLKHLNLHQKYQHMDIKNYSNCSYCLYKNDNFDDLIQHIIQQHGNSKYQCSYCFYRSYDKQIYTHCKLFHTTKSLTIIECATNAVDYPNETEDAWKNSLHICRPIICGACKGKFYNIVQFESHLKSYEGILLIRCLKCKSHANKDNYIDHLKDCHGFGNYICAYCIFETDSMSGLAIHLSNFHCEKPLQFFDRSTKLKTSDIGPNILKSKIDLSKYLALKKIIADETKYIKKVYRDTMELENANNINTILYASN